MGLPQVTGISQVIRVFTEVETHEANKLHRPNFISYQAYAN